MINISIFESRVREFIRVRKDIHVSTAENNVHMGKWDGKAWGKTPARYRFSRSLGDTYSKRYLSEKRLDDADLIPYYYREFLKAYLSYLCLERSKTSYALSDITYAFRDLAHIICKINLPMSELSIIQLKKYEIFVENNFSAHACESRGAAISALIEFMAKRNMLSNAINYANPFIRKETAQRVTESRSKKMPELAVLNAVAEIYAKEMYLKTEYAHQKNDRCNKELTMDRIACAQTSLLFAAPSRIGELPLLGIDPMSIIKTQNSETYTLRWRGSKGMVDHEKHIHTDMVPIVKNSIEYLHELGWKARVLARFYEDPNISRKKLFNGIYNLKTIATEGESKISLWELAGVLELFDEDELTKLKEIRRWPKSEKPTSSQKTDLEIVSFGDLCPQFPFNVSPETVVSHLIARNIFNLGVFINLPFQPKGTFMTMGELESRWISYMRKSIPDFPYIYEGVAGKRVKYSQALFVVRGGQLPRQSARFSFGNSRFSIMKSSSNLVATWGECRGENKRNLFNRYGYDVSEFHLKTNQIRHFLNTLAQRADLHEEVIAMWSGRKNTSQNVVYNHETQSESEAKLSAKGFIGGQKKVVPVTEEEVRSLIGTEYAARTDKGYCSQSLHVNPCTSLKIGSGGCVGCPSHCHIKGDLEGLVNLQEDMKTQILRIIELKPKNIINNVIMQRWLDLHIRNIKIMVALEGLLSSSEIEDGAVIRYAKGSQFEVVLDGIKRTIDLELKLPKRVVKALDGFNLAAQGAESDSETEFDRLIQAASTDLKPLNRLEVLKS